MRQSRRPEIWEFPDPTGGHSSAAPEASQTALHRAPSSSSSSPVVPPGAPPGALHKGAYAPAPQIAGSPAAGGRHGRYFEERFIFRGRGAELLHIYCINILLTLLTLGFYLFWARVNVARYIYSNTELNGCSFHFHGTGKEKCLGFFMAALIAAIWGGLLYLLYIYLNAPPILAYLFSYGSALLIVPYIWLGKQRYNLSRSSYRNLRFHFTGSYRSLISKLFGHLLLSLFSLGLYAPALYYQIRRYMTSNSYYGDTPFRLEGSAGRFTYIFYRSLFFSMLTAGLYIPWGLAAMKRYLWQVSRFQNASFYSDIGGFQIAATALKSKLLILTVIGIPWAAAMRRRLDINTVALRGRIDPAAIKAHYDSKASSLAEGFQGLSDILDAFG